MAATFRSVSTATTGSTPTNSLTINLPAGAVAGDALYAAIAIDNATAIGTPPSGWTNIKSVNQSTNIGTTLWYRTANNYESSSYTWSWTGNQQAAGLIIDYSGTNQFPSGQFASVNGTSTTPNTNTFSDTWSGVILYFYGTKNTVNSCTLTPPGGWTQRADVSTTASSFIEIEVQEKPTPFPVGGFTSTTTSTSPSTSVNYAGIGAAISDANQTVPLSMDCIANNSGTSGTSFNITNFVNYPNTVLVAMAASEQGTIALTSSGIATSAGTTLTWNKFATYGAAQQGGDLEIWYTFTSAALQPLVSSGVGSTTTATFNGTIISADVLIFSITGADITNTTGLSAFGATASNNASASSNPTVNLSTTRNNSWVFAVANSSNSSGLTAGAGSNQTVMHSHSKNTATVSSSIMLMQNSATPVSGTSVTMNSSSSTITNWNIYAFEILPAFGHGLTIGGIGQ